MMADTATNSVSRPIWAECVTSHMLATESFYDEVFGWTTEYVSGSDGGVYAVQRLGGKIVAGIRETAAGDLRPSHWATYFGVENIDSTLGGVTAAGGTLLHGPVEAPGVGTIAEICDPAGARLHLWHPAPGHGAQLMHVPGAMTWNEVCTSTPNEAAEFYTRVFGFSTATIRTGETHYTLLKAGDQPVAGILAKTPEMGDVPHAWDVYFASANVDETVAAVRRAGGKVPRPPFDLPNGARMAVCADSQGAVFEVIRMTPRPG